MTDSTPEGAHAWIIGAGMYDDGGASVAGLWALGFGASPYDDEPEAEPEPPEEMIPRSVHDAAIKELRGRIDLLILENAVLKGRVNV